MTTVQPALARNIGTFQAIATNMLGMIGVGPFLTIPLMATAMGDLNIGWAWLVGGVLALCDGLVYAQLGAALPGSGGAYLYLREAFEPLGFGKFMGFMFVFQVLLIAPLSIAGGAVGFANYLGFFFANMLPIAHHSIAALLCLVVTLLLYRPTADLGKVSVAMLTVVCLTLAWIIVTAWLSPAHQPKHVPSLSHQAWLPTLAAGSMLAMYNYGGYNTICNLGDEIKNPSRTLPRAVLISIVLIAGIYLLLSDAFMSVLPMDVLAHTPTLATQFIQTAYQKSPWGSVASNAMNVLVLFVTATSLYALILGYSRVPYAAARGGQFFQVFGRIHPTKRFPHIALIFIGVLAIPFCFVPLKSLVNWLMLVQIAVQFIWQCAAVILLRRYRKDIPQPFTMWLYPLPAVVALVMWLSIFVTSGFHDQLLAVAFIALSILAYRIFTRFTYSGANPLEVRSL